MTNSPSPLQAADAPALRVSVPGIQLEINGTREVPKGLFGTHAVPLDEQRIQEWGIEAHRHLDQNPSGKPRDNETPILMECFSTATSRH